MPYFSGNCKEFLKKYKKPLDKSIGLWYHFSCGYTKCGYGGIGRRTGFRILRETVQVRPLLPASIHMQM